MAAPMRKEQKNTAPDFYREHRRRLQKWNWKKEQSGSIRRTGTDAVSPEFLTEVQQKYQNGCEAIFTDGGSFEPIVRKAAETTGGKVIGIVTDESQKSTAAVISAENKYEEILTEELEKIKTKNSKEEKPQSSESRKTPSA